MIFALSLRLKRRENNPPQFPVGALCKRTHLRKIHNTNGHSAMLILKQLFFGLLLPAVVTGGILVFARSLASKEEGESTGKKTDISRGWLIAGILFGIECWLHRRIFRFGGFLHPTFSAASGNPLALLSGYHRIYRWMLLAFFFFGTFDSTDSPVDCYTATSSEFNI